MWAIGLARLYLGSKHGATVVSSFHVTAVFPIALRHLYCILILPYVNMYIYFPRLSISELKKEKGLRSQLSIERADRQDSGLYRCQASNSYGRSEHFIHLAVQGMYISKNLSSFWPFTTKCVFHYMAAWPLFQSIFQSISMLWDKSISIRFYRSTT